MKITQFLVVVVFALAVPLAYGKTPAIEEYVPQHGNLLPVELVIEDFDTPRLGELRRELTNLGRWRLERKSDRESYPGKCFVTLRKSGVEAYCHFGVDPGVPWALSETPRHSLAPKLYRDGKDAVTAMKNFSLKTFRRDTPPPATRET